MIIELTVNGTKRAGAVASDESLLTFLREELHLPGSKNACEQGECGSCSVVVDGELVCSCLVMAADTADSEVLTVEGLAGEGALHPIQEALVSGGGVQCGFCTPGFAVAAAYLFQSDPHPSTDDIREALSGNICRCTGYGGILRGLERLAGRSPQ